LAQAALHAVLSDLNKAGSAAERARLASELRASGALLGLLQQAPEVWLKGPMSETADIDALIDERLRARQAKNFAEADRIRAELAIRGILLEDKPGGKTEWRRAV
jgi:cysteinyl-tRNA synthetase